MKKFLLIFFCCLMALSLLSIGALLLNSDLLANQSPQTESPTTETMPAYELNISLNGEQDVFLEYGKDYTEPGAVATLLVATLDLDIPVEITGEVDTSKLGTYLVTYTANADDLTATASRNVHIVDTQLPKITLVVDPYAYTIPGQAYQEEGFRAIDNYDGDITDQVICKEEDGIVTYTVTDSSGNSFTTQRTIHYFDPGKPNLKLSGDDTYLVVQGEPFKDPWVTAVDKNDGDITSSVYVESNLDTNVPGHYTLKYTATNSYCYSGSITRTVIVLPKEYLQDSAVFPEDYEIPQGGIPYEENGKTIYLTFDDGPTQHTEKLLNTLAKYNTKVSFFVKNSSYMDLITRAAKEGHTVAIHTYSHDYKKIYTSEEAFYEDMSEIQKLITKYTSKVSKILRFPGGSSNTISQLYNRGIMTRLAKSLTEKGYTYFDWNVDSNDAGGAKTVEEVFNNITKGLRWHDDAVVLQHDTKEFSVDAVERIIVWGLVNGYTFAPLTEDSPDCHHPINN